MERSIKAINKHMLISVETVGNEVYVRTYPDQTSSTVRTNPSGPPRYPFVHQKNDWVRNRNGGLPHQGKCVREHPIYGL
jgi:hypothetical protein